MRLTRLALPLLILLAACSPKKAEHGDAAHGEDDSHGAATATKWTYDGDTGPDHWAAMGGGNTVCGAGTRQSPVDISGQTPQRHAKIQFAYNSSLATIQNNGHTVVVTPSDGGGVIVDGTLYKLKSFHFHSPSEHAINGQRTALETHFVHQNAAGDYLVIGVLYNVGAADPMLASLWTYLPSDPGQPVPLPDILINAQDLMPANEDYYVYSGSLTTPPCAEGVTWMVNMSPLTVSAEQADAFSRLVGPNARPLQPRNERDYLQVSGD
ncbi:MAG: carbonic anhydrase family protein [Asticcacaulis sp.]|nr:carbonic anhydrase family protein [Asticcacaulis sp.]